MSQSACAFDDHLRGEHSLWFCALLPLAAFAFLGTPVMTWLRERQLLAWDVSAHPVVPVHTRLSIGANLVALVVWALFVVYALLLEAIDSTQSLVNCATWLLGATLGTQVAVRMGLYLGERRVRR